MTSTEMGPAAIRLISWNVNRRPACWHEIAGEDCDVALLQEAPPPPAGLSTVVPLSRGGWETEGHGAWRTVVVAVSDRAEVVPLEQTTPGRSRQGAVPESVPGSLAIAEVAAPGIEPVVVASAYAAWETPRRGEAFGDGAAHRLISDLSALVVGPGGHRVVVAGDWNILYGYGEGAPGPGADYWSGRYQTVFDRMAAIGFEFVGPQHPGGVQAHPWPDELPPDSRNVPTFRHRGQATRQLDFVFASSSLAAQVTTRARNEPEDWGPSDHCRIVIEVTPD